MARRKSRYSGIGGQAVLEGVMMKNKEKYAVAVRKPDGEIEGKWRPIRVWLTEVSSRSFPLSVVSLISWIP